MAGAALALLLFFKLPVQKQCRLECDIRPLAQQQLSLCFELVAHKAANCLVEM